LRNTSKESIVVREMSDFRTLSKYLEDVAKVLNTKVWICEKIGRRLSCVARAGEESYSEAYQVYEDDKYVVFAERQLNNSEESELIIDFIVKYLKVGDCK